MSFREGTPEGHRWSIGPVRGWQIPELATIADIPHSISSEYISKSLPPLSLSLSQMPSAVSILVANRS